MSIFTKLEEVISELDAKEKALQQKTEVLDFLATEATDGYWVLDFPQEKEFSEYTIEEIREWDEYLSPKFKEILGYKDEELPNKCSSWMDLIHPEDFERATGDLMAHIFEGSPYKMMVRYKHKDREDYSLNVFCRGKTYFKDGKPFRMVGTHTLI